MSLSYAFVKVKNGCRQTHQILFDVVKPDGVQHFFLLEWRLHAVGLSKKRSVL